MVDLFEKYLLIVKLILETIFHCIAMNGCKKKTQKKQVYQQKSGWTTPKQKNPTKKTWKRLEKAKKDNPAGLFYIIIIAVFIYFLYNFGQSSILI